jgi:proline iminopeptidase
MKMNGLLQNSIFIFLCFLTATVLGQKADSIKYENGYLHFTEYGKGEPILILAGGPGVNCAEQLDVALELSKNYRAILLEQRGSGKSIPVPFDSTTITLENAEKDIVLLLHYLKIKSIIIYGHSWGGMLAMSFAANYPKMVRGLVLASTSSYKMGREFFWETLNLNRDVRWGKCEWEQRNKRDSISKTRALTPIEKEEGRKLFFLSNIFDKSQIDSLYNKISVADINFTTTSLMMSNVNLVKFDLSKTLPKYKGLIIAICGRQDPLSFLTYELKILLPSVELNWIQSCGHFPMFESPAKFYPILNRSVEKIIISAK